MNREKAFALEFENPALKIVAAPHTDPIDSVLVCVYDAQGFGVIEFNLNKADLLTFNKALDIKPRRELIFCYGKGATAYELQIGLWCFRYCFLYGGRWRHPFQLARFSLTHYPEDE